MAARWAGKTQRPHTAAPQASSKVQANTPGQRGGAPGGGEMPRGALGEQHSLLRKRPPPGREGGREGALPQPPPPLSQRPRSRCRRPPSQGAREDSLGRLTRAAPLWGSFPRERERESPAEDASRAEPPALRRSQHGTLRSPRAGGGCSQRPRRPQPHKSPLSPLPGALGAPPSPSPLASRGASPPTFWVGKAEQEVAGRGRGLLLELALPPARPPPALEVAEELVPHALGGLRRPPRPPHQHCKRPPLRALRHPCPALPSSAFAFASPPAFPGSRLARPPSAQETAGRPPLSFPRL